MSVAPQPPAPLPQGTAGYISSERLTPFLQATRGHKLKALRLYRLNVELAGAVYETLHYAEVILRNSMDAQLKVWNDSRGRGASWTLTPDVVLERVVDGNGKHLQRAQEKAWTSLNPTKRLAVAGWNGGRKPQHCDVLPALSFGTWVTLLPGSGTQPRKVLLWNQSLKYAFPFLTGAGASGTSDDLTRDAQRMLQIRNRVAHLEPLLDTKKVYEALSATKRCLSSIDGSVMSWAMSKQRVTDQAKAIEGFLLELNTAR